MKTYWEELRSLCAKKRFVLCVALLALVAYGFSVTNSTIYIDTLENERYLGSGQEMLQAGRFTFTLLGKLVGYVGAVPQNESALEILTILGLILAGANLCILFRRICGSALSDNACLVFICVFLTYPLYIELLPFTSAMLCVSFCHICSSYALLLIHSVLHDGKSGRWGKLALASGLMMLVCAGYEAAVPVYIASVFAVLFLQVVYPKGNERRVREILRQGLCYAAVLVVGLVLRLAVHRVLLRVFHLTAQRNGETLILWGKSPASEILRNLAATIYMDYILNAMINFPITELVVAGILLLLILIFGCRKYGPSILLPSAGMYFSLIALSLVQGSVSPYRTCHVFALFVAFVLMYLVMLVEGLHGKCLRPIILCLCAFLCFQQARYVNYFATINHLRAEEEAFVIRTVGTDLQKNNALEKPLVFLGGHPLSSYLEESGSIPENSFRWGIYWDYYDSKDYFPPYSANRFVPQNGVSSVFSWGVHAFNQEGVQHLFQFYGFDISIPESEKFGEYFQFAVDYAQDQQMPSYPMDGYIQDVGDFIVVNMESTH